MADKEVKKKASDGQMFKGSSGFAGHGWPGDMCLISLSREAQWA